MKMMDMRMLGLFQRIRRAAAESSSATMDCASASFSSVTLTTTAGMDRMREISVVSVFTFEPSWPRDCTEVREGWGGGGRESGEEERVEGGGRVGGGREGEGEREWGGGG